MKVAQSKGHLHDEKFGCRFREVLDFRQVAEKLAALDEFHEEIYPKLGLEHVFHVDQEWVVRLLEHIFLSGEVLDVVQLDDEVLADRLHRI